MTGYTNTIRAANPSAFWTFDFEKNNISTTVADELGISNLTVQNSQNQANYSFETQSLIEIETTDSFSMRVGHSSKPLGGWSPCSLSTPNTTAFEFSNNGEFSLEFFYRKESPGELRDVGEPGHDSVITTPLVSKLNSFEVDTINYFHGITPDKLEARVLGHTVGYSGGDVMGTTHHVVLIFRTLTTDINEITATLELYVDGRLVDADSVIYVDSTPNTSSANELRFFGNGGGIPNEDFAAETTKMDQISIFKRALSLEEVANHYRKTKNYHEMIKFDKPIYFYPMREPHLNLDNDMKQVIPGAGNVTHRQGAYLGSVTRDIIGPLRITGSRCAEFLVGGRGYVENGGASGANLLSTQADYTIEFWFNSNDKNMGTLLDISEEDSVYSTGGRVFLNKWDHVHTPGRIQFNESHNKSLKSLEFTPDNNQYNFSDGNWHMVTIMRRGMDVMLYIDAELHAMEAMPTTVMGAPGDMHVMNSRNSDAPINGFMCNLALYNKSLQEQQIYNRWAYSTRYRISGHTYLQGSPVTAIVRFYDSLTGALLNETKSAAHDGSYSYYPFNNRKVDALYKLKDNQTVKYRTHGPINPAEVPDPS